MPYPMPPGPPLRERLVKYAHTCLPMSVEYGQGRLSGEEYLSRTRQVAVNEGLARSTGQTDEAGVPVIEHYIEYDAILACIDQQVSN